ncbi:HD domain-containing protein [Olivibacter sp. XZL3]|uniref:HD domain-containing protein n=1 Tax=Olivibacter sp. XZL3 TaxID=1735116 RepID=UPI0010669134|nr:HD domain-containing protein [Olivibacter sp. XZL3]
MQLERVTTFLLDKLKRELSPVFTYHNAAHTKDVMHAAEHIGRQEHIGENESTILTTAALFHDTGFLVSADNHEAHSCEIARTQLPHYLYNEQQIDQVCSLIMATKTPQQPKNYLEQIICDADLDYLGREDFFDISERLYQEMTHLGTITSHKEYLVLQLDFLSEHQYFTRTARELRNEIKEKNLLKTKSFLYP